MISKNFNLKENIMDKKKAKEIMRLYIEGQLEMYKDILGEEEDFDWSSIKYTGAHQYQRLMKS